MRFTLFSLQDGAVVDRPGKRMALEHVVRFVFFVEESRPLGYPIQSDHASQICLQRVVPLYCLTLFSPTELNRLSIVNTLSTFFRFIIPAMVLIVEPFVNFQINPNFAHLFTSNPRLKFVVPTNKRAVEFPCKSIP